MNQLVVGAVVVDSLDRPALVLAARRSRPADLAGRWEFPGGKVEPGEAPREALVRELAEELRVVVEVRAELGSWPIDEDRELRLFLAVLLEGEPLPGETHDEVRWLDSRQLATVTWLPSDEAALPVVRQALRR